ncbi:MAG TPA: glycerate kinase [Actinomycetales bacterium]|nr:glycerate kinase [Actinomycetales bacterium]
MRVLVAPDRFGTLLSAAECADALARGWRAQAPGDQLDLCPLSDGGAGFVDAVAAGTSGPAQLLPVTVSGPTGRDVPATVLLVSTADGMRTAYLEAGQAVGPALLDPDAVDRTRTTSVGVGQLLVAALDAGAQRVVVGCGPAVSHDGGAGMLSALGLEPEALLGGGAVRLRDLPDDALTVLPDVRERFAHVDLVAATDSVLPLLGFHGMSATLAQPPAEQPLGAIAAAETPERAQRLEQALGRWADAAQRSLVAGRPLSGRGYAGEPGSGCAGGVAFGLMLLGARRTSGVQAVMDAVGVSERLQGMDLVLTAEQSFDRTSLQDQVVSGVADAATALGIPTVVVSGLVELGRREALAAGVAGAYALAERPADLPSTSGEVDAALEARARRTARTWSR